MKKIALILILTLILFSSETLSQSKTVYNSEYLTDQSGNTYKTVKIGTNVWMAENFKGKHYSNGDAIKEFNLGSGEIIRYRDNIFCVLKNDTYVYSWDAIIDSRGIAPAGWHVPSKAEWDELLKYCNSYKDIRSVSGWPTIEEWGGYEEIYCPNCKNWNTEYRSKRRCDRCQDTRIVRTGKFIPKKTISTNGTNRLNFNIKHVGYFDANGHQMKRDAFWTNEVNESASWESYVFEIYTHLFMPSISGERFTDHLLPLRLVKNKE